jgi:hypothetical protein
VTSEYVNAGDRFLETFSFLCCCSNQFIVLSSMASSSSSAKKIRKLWWNSLPPVPVAMEQPKENLRYCVPCPGNCGLASNYHEIALFEKDEFAKYCCYRCYQINVELGGRSNGKTTHGWKCKGRNYDSVVPDPSQPQMKMEMQP